MGSNHLAHWGLSDAFEEAKVSRDGVGRFARKAAAAATDVADAGKDELHNAIMSSDKILQGLFGYETTTTPDIFADQPVQSGANGVVKMPDDSFDLVDAVKKVVDSIFSVSSNTTDSSSSTLRETYSDKLRHDAFGNVDYVGMAIEDPKDLKQHGVKGQKWGVRRSSSELRAASGKRSTSKAPEKKDEPAAPHPGSRSGASSHDRYEFVRNEVKNGRGPHLSETDLKFYNARTEALAKLDKIKKSDPSWLSSTSKTVLQSTATKTLQQISDGVAKKYIGDPILDAINSKSVEKEASEALAKQARQKIIEEVLAKGKQS